MGPLYPHKQGMVWNSKWNGNFSIEYRMEDARMEWNGRFQEWNER